MSKTNPSLDAVVTDFFGQAFDHVLRQGATPAEAQKIFDHAYRRYTSLITTLRESEEMYRDIVLDSWEAAAFQEAYRSSGNIPGGNNNLVWKSEDRPFYERIIRERHGEQELTTSFGSVSNNTYSPTGYGMLLVEPDPQDFMQRLRGSQKKGRLIFFTKDCFKEKYNSGRFTYGTLVVKTHVDVLYQLRDSFIENPFRIRGFLRSRCSWETTERGETPFTCTDMTRYMTRLYSFHNGNKEFSKIMI